MATKTENANLFAALRAAFPADLSACAVETDAGLQYSWRDLDQATAMVANLFEFLELPKGIPSHDTFGRIFAKIKPEEFQKRFIEWVQAIEMLTSGQVIAVDGKKLRRSHDQEAGKDVHLNVDNIQLTINDLEGRPLLYNVWVE